MSATANRRGSALAMALVLIAVCVSFSFPVFLDGGTDADVPEKVIIVPKTTGDSPLEDIVLDYASISTEAKHQESMGRDPMIADPGMPSDDGDRKVVEEMRDMIGKDRFVPKDGPPEDGPQEDGVLPEKRDPHPEIVRMDERAPAPDVSFMQDVADLLDRTDDDRFGRIADDIRNMIPWIIIFDLNDALSTASCPQPDRKIDGSEDDADEDIHLEDETEDEDIPLPENGPPTPIPTIDSEYDGGIPPFYYSGVTTSG